MSVFFWLFVLDVPINESILPVGTTIGRPPSPVFTTSGGNNPCPTLRTYTLASHSGRGGTLWRDGEGKYPRRLAHTVCMYLLFFFLSHYITLVVTNRKNIGTLCEFHMKFPFALFCFLRFLPRFFASPMRTPPPAASQCPHRDFLYDRP